MCRLENLRILPLMKTLTKSCPKCGHEVRISGHEAASLLASRTSDAKAEAARQNGRRGGRPKLPTLPCVAWWNEPTGNGHDVRVIDSIVKAGKRWFVVPMGDNPAPALVPSEQLEFYRD